MAFKPTNKTITLIARSFIKKGDAVQVLWRNYVRRAKIGGVAMETKRKGSHVKIMYLGGGNTSWFEVDVVSSSGRKAWVCSLVASSQRQRLRLGLCQHHYCFFRKLVKLSSKEDSLSIRELK